jgi:hypothetical protein
MVANSQFPGAISNFFGDHACVSSTLQCVASQHHPTLDMFPVAKTCPRIFLPVSLLSFLVLPCVDTQC